MCEWAALSSCSLTDRVCGALFSLRQAFGDLRRTACLFFSPPTRGEERKEKAKGREEKRRDKSTMIQSEKPRALAIGSEFQAHGGTYVDTEICVFIFLMCLCSPRSSYFQWTHRWARAICVCACLWSTDQRVSSLHPILVVPECPLRSPPSVHPEEDEDEDDERGKKRRGCVYVCVYPRALDLHLVISGSGECRRRRRRQWSSRANKRLIISFIAHRARRTRRWEMRSGKEEEEEEGKGDGEKN